MLDYVCKNGVREYAIFREFPLTVEQDGEIVAIPQQTVHDADKTLDVYHSSSDGHHMHREKLHEKVNEWLNQMNKNGHLPPTLV
jgi:chromosome condensin MukBEF MukE localization factor